MQQDLQNKKGLVQGVFNQVFDKYDLMNDILSLGSHRLWKKQMISWLSPSKNKTLLDVASGTGDVARLFLQYTKNKSSVCAVDPI
jgi:demethylmenaquinone methyltransferase/2-methoxy-6-polyprenyl-1,4-benzoquinol methylase